MNKLIIQNLSRLQQLRDRRPPQPGESAIKNTALVCAIIHFLYPFWYYPNTPRIHLPKDMADLLREIDSRTQDHEFLLAWLNITK